MGIFNKWRRKQQFSMSYKTLHLDFGFSVLKSWRDNPWVMWSPHPYKGVKMETCRLGGKANHLPILPLVCGYILAWQWIDPEILKKMLHIKDSKPPNGNWGIPSIIQELVNTQEDRNVTTTPSIIRHSSSYIGVIVSTGIYSICKCSTIIALSHTGWDSSSHTVICNQ